VSLQCCCQSFWDPTPAMKLTTIHPLYTTGRVSEFNSEQQRIALRKIIYTVQYKLGKEDNWKRMFPLVSSAKSKIKAKISFIYNLRKLHWSTVSIMELHKKGEWERANWGTRSDVRVWRFTWKRVADNYSLVSITL
jgi:hypothetical protein